jgi:hypothetical protein
VVGLRFVPAFVLVFAFWVISGTQGDIGFLKNRKLHAAYLSAGVMMLAATSLHSAGAFGNDVIWQSALPGRERLLAAFLVILAANLLVGVQNYRVLKAENISTFVPLFGTCFMGYLIIVSAAVAVDHQYNLLNRHYLDQRRPIAYVSRHPYLDRALAANVGPDLADLLRSPDFQQALRAERFYKQDYDEPFQVVEHAVMYGYRVDRNSHGQPLFRTIRFPLEIALALRFEPRPE